ncbi:MAG TPA: hypothetical protein VKA10_05335 [Prolixibacteraceae bacterium]|nr:hypothetical protein [Prolixibacteraceae bacterium]
MKQLIVLTSMFIFFCGLAQSQVLNFSYDAENNNIVTFKLSNSSGDEVELFTVNIADLNQH